MIVTALTEQIFRAISSSKILNYLIIREIRGIKQITHTGLYFRKYQGVCYSLLYICIIFYFVMVPGIQFLNFVQNKRHYRGKEY